MSQTTMEPAAMMFGDLEHEIASTRRMLERVPGDRLDYRPHDKSYSLGELAAHIANIPNWMMTIVVQDDLDLETLPSERNAPKAPDEILADFDAAAARAQEAVKAAPAAAWGATWTLRSGGEVHFAMPRAAVLRSMGINHLVHHRAQLGVYLRMLDVAVPGMYGPSADEM